MIADFDFAASPHIHFGSGRRNELISILKGYGSRILLVTGSQSFDISSKCRALLEELQAGFELQRLRIEGEPTPALVDEAVAEYRGFSPDAVVAIGGGSTVDAAKAVAGLIPLGHSVLDYLEGVGRGRVYAGPPIPFIAIPTTAGTGGETSKNAVLSEVGDGGFKKSFRHELLVARHIILDPELTMSCPPDVTAACGMDAFTQLLESYVSVRANPITDALSESGMGMIRDSLLKAVKDGEDLKARTGMLYASSMSGLTLANAGLGSVHGLASAVGALFPIPHGVVCGTLVYEASRTNIHCMKERDAHNKGLLKYAEAGRLLVNNPVMDDEEARRELLKTLDDWTERLAMPRLSSFGITKADISHIVSNSRGNSMKTNPINLSDDEIAEIVSRRL